MTAKPPNEGSPPLNKQAHEAPATPSSSFNSPQTPSIPNAVGGAANDNVQTRPLLPSHPPSYQSSFSPHTSHITSADEYFGYSSGPGNGDLELDVPPPAYSERYGEIVNQNDRFDTNASVADDGRVNIRINEKHRRLSSLLVPALNDQIDADTREPPPPSPYIPPSLGGHPGQTPPPRLNVVIHIVGSRGDVQPFVALGKVLKETYGHRVRLATHAVFKGFVEENGLEFFNIGGDPSELMAFMVKNPGLMPGISTLRSGEIGKRRKAIAEMIRGCWRSCIEAGDGMDTEAMGRSVEEWVTSNANATTGGTTPHKAKPFIADAIIANPPSFAHIHCAEKLGVPLHMMFTMPWSPTQSFPHPLANIQSSNADISITNSISYVLVDMLTWQGLGDVINRFRKEWLGLEPISMMFAPGMLARLRIPYTYCWSPSLIPKPKDWGSHISISGFYFLSLASTYTPAPELDAFLRAGSAPVYIGFGSIVVDDPNAMTQLIFDAVRIAGQRALVSKGWGGLGADQLDIPDGVFMLGNVPHDWLFQHVSCVVHHGGAGTTAAGIAAGKPTVVVPFFGDQPFWGAMVAKAGAGPVPIPHKQLTAENLAAAILDALNPESVERAQELSSGIAQERGSDTGALYFHRMLKVDELRCSLLPERVAVWRVRRTKIRLSALAAILLVTEGYLTYSDLKSYRAREYDTEDSPLEPITGATGAFMSTMMTMVMGVADFPIETMKALRIHQDNRRQRTEASLSTPLLLPAPSSAGQSQASNGTVMSLPNTSTVSISDSSSLTGTATVASPVQTSLSVPTAISRPASRDSNGIPVQENSHSSFSSHRSRSPFSITNRSSHHRAKSDSGTAGMTADAALATGKGVSRIIGAGLKSPMDISLALAKGFHNASRLYGEQPRQVDRVTGLQSGLKVAAKEFGYGMYNGVAGLVTHPYEGAKKEGSSGFVKGVGRGIAGVTLKPIAAFWGLPAYTFQGIYKAIQKPLGADTQAHIFHSRIAQGQEDLQKLTPDEYTAVLRRWVCGKTPKKPKRNLGEDQYEAIQKLIDKGRQRRKGKQAEFNYSIKRKPVRSTPSLISAHQRSSSDLSRNAFYDPVRSSPTSLSPSQKEDAELETAIAASIAQTSTGNTEEDEMIARAIRASLAELNKPRSDELDDEEALNRAIQASVAEAERTGQRTGGQSGMLESSLRRSLTQTRRAGIAFGEAPIDSDDEWWDSDDDEALLERAMNLSRQGSGEMVDRTDTKNSQLTFAAQRTQASPQPIAQPLPLQVSPAPVTIPPPVPERPREVLEQRAPDPHTEESESEEDMLRRALELSQQEERERKERERREAEEERIVMEYVKRQSLAEEEHRLAMLATLRRGNTQ